MGSDDLFKKRKAQKAEALQRKKQTREKNKRYLIVCEGKKTEPNYFRELVLDLGINSRIVHVAENNGSAPVSVVNHAINFYNDDAKNGDPYDQVYCVFDRDNHTTFANAVQQIKDSKKQDKPLVAITSTPCFEVWFLLHFGYTSQPFCAAGNKSVGDQVVNALKTKEDFANYAKGQKNVYSLLKNKLEEAIINAEKLRQDSLSTGSKNPSTDTDKLVLALVALKS